MCILDGKLKFWVSIGVGFFITVCLALLLHLQPQDSTAQSHLRCNAAYCDEAFCVESYCFEDFYLTMVNMQLRIDAQRERSSILFFGDSITQALNVSELEQRAINYGIGGDTTTALLERLPRYNTQTLTTCIVLAIGVNDFYMSGVESVFENYQQLLKVLPVTIPIIVSAVLPVDDALFNVTNNTNIQRLNRLTKELVEQHQHVHWVDVGSRLLNSDSVLAENMHLGDGIHLNATGSKIVIAGIEGLLQSHCKGAL